MKALVRRWLNRAARAPRHSDPLAAALGWLSGHTAADGGVIVHTGRREPYPEVTGYLVPTLLDAGQFDLAVSFTRYLLKIQAPDGSFGIGGQPYVFDTCQVLEAFLCAPPELKAECDAAAGKALHWLNEQLEPSGLFNTRWHDRLVPAAIHLRGLRNAVLAARHIGDSELAQAFERSARAYLADPATLSDEVLSHFYGYVVDGVAWFEPQRAQSMCAAAAARQAPDGSLPARPGVGWICFPGLAQIALWWHVFGMGDSAQRALDFLCRVQRASGGMTGGNGEYFPRVELSWACKFFVDLWLRVHGLTAQRSLPVPVGTSS